METTIREDLHDWVKELFYQVFTGPPRAYFELCDNRRGIYRVWALGTTDLSREEELVTRFKAHLTDLKTRGGVSLFWRRRIERQVEKGTVMLNARFVVWDIHGNEVTWANNFAEECPDGLPRPLLP